MAENTLVDNIENTEEEVVMAENTVVEGTETQNTEEVVTMTTAALFEELKGKSRHALIAQVKELQAQGHNITISRSAGEGSGKGTRNKEELAHAILAVLENEIATGEVSVVFADGSEEVSVIKGADETKKLFINSPEVAKDLISKTISHERFVVQAFNVHKTKTTPILGTVASIYADFVPDQTLDLMTKGGSTTATNAIEGVYAMEFHGGGRKIGAELAELGGYVVPTEDGIDILVPHLDLNDEVNGYTSLMTRKRVVVLPATARKISTIGNSASGQRKDQFIFVTEEIGKSFKEFTNKTFNNAYELNLLGKFGSMKTLNAAMGRLHHRSTAQEVIGNIGTFAMFTGELAGGTTDGSSFLNVTTEKEMFEQYLSFHYNTTVVLTTEAIKGMSLQTRGATLKDQSIPVTGTYIDLAIEKTLREGAQLVVVQREDLTIDESLRLQSLENTVVIVTDEEDFTFGSSKVDLLFDDNAKKLNFDLGMSFEMHMLKVVKKIKQVYTTGQIFSKFAHLPGGMDLIKELAQESINSALANFEENSKAGNFVSESELNKSDVTGTAAKILSKDALKFFPFIEKDIVMSQWNEIFKKIAKLRFEIAGAFLTAEIDPSVLITVEGIMAKDEIFVSDSKTAEAILIKFPSVHYREYLRARFITMVDIKSRVEALLKADEITLRQAKAIATAFAMKGEQTICTGSQDVLKDLMAGYDTDTDAFEVVTDERVLEVMKDQTPLAVIIKKPVSEKEEENYSLEIENFGLSVRKTLEVEGMSIGEATFTGETIASILMVAAEKRPAVLGILFGKFGTEEYVGLERSTVDGFDAVTVDEENAHRVVSSLEGTKFTAGNAELIIEDLVAIVRYLQEVTIDAPKTGFNSEVKLNLNVYGTKKRVDTALHIKLTDPTIDEEGNLCYTTPTQNDRVQYMPHPLHALRLELIEQVREVLQERLDALPATPPAALARQIRDAVPEHLTASVINWQSTYIGIQQEYINNVAPEVNEETGEMTALSEDQMTHYRQLRKRQIQSLVNSVRMETADLDAVERGLIAMNMSLLNRDGDYKENYGNRFYRILPLELFSVLSHFATQIKDKDGKQLKDAGFFGQEIVVVEKYNADIITNGTTVEFDGASGACVSHYGKDENSNKMELVIPTTGLDGQYLIIVRNKKYYAIKTLSQALVRLAEVNRNELLESDSYQVFVRHNENKVKAYEKLKDAKKVMVVAKGGRDFLCTEDGVAVAGIYITKGADALRGQLDGRLFDVEFLSYSESDGFQNLMVSIKNGFYVGQTVSLPKGKLVNNNGFVGKPKAQVETKEEKQNLVEEAEALFEDLY